MGNTTESKLRESQLESNGWILSGFSHELKNHLAVINESNGLLQDYIEMGRITDQHLAEKLQNILTQIDNRTQIISEMARQLNSFGHRFDFPESTFDLKNIVQEQLFFLQRAARLRKISLKIDMPEDDMNINSNPSLVQFIFGQLYNLATETLQENDQLSISMAQQDPGIYIRLTLKGESPLHLPQNSVLTMPEFLLGLKKINGTIDINRVDNMSQELILSLAVCVEGA